MTLDLDALQRLCDEATPGPWRWQDWHYRGNPDEGPDKNALTADPETRGDAPSATFPDLRNCILYDEEFREEAEADRAFIAAARTALPEALAEIRRLAEKYDFLFKKFVSRDAFATGCALELGEARQELAGWTAKLEALEAEIVALRTRWERAIEHAVEDGGDGYAESLSAEWYGLHRALEIMTGGTK